ncbi:RidA family protein [Massilioclostridium coli]|uniref:RidA family protein n=1 Tax=Massilioclostridium coli TaxID=1870991 RepID=UPI0022E60435|nr:RidA family protein [Massilioclostridium coli]
MNRTEINTKNAPEALGPYSQAIRIGDLIFTSGQIPIDPATNTLVSGGIVEQATQSLRNLQAVLTEAGSSLSDAVKVTVFVKNMDDFAKLNEIYGSFFTEPYPARSCVEVARLPKDVLVEIEIVALAK